MVERVKAVIEYYGMTDRAFALTCGIKQNTLNYHLNGKRELSLTTIESILKTFSDVSSEWLIRGKEPMLLSQQKPDENTERITSLVDTISTLTSVVNDKDTRIKQLEAELENLKKK